MKYFVLCLVFVSFVSCKQEQSTEVKIISPEEMQELTSYEDVQLVDVRSPQEYNKGYIANAQNIDYNSESFDIEIEKLDKSKPVIVYCQKGGRSAKCSKKLEDKGFVKIYDLEGGIAKWKYKGFQINTIVDQVK